MEQVFQWLLSSLAGQCFIHSSGVVSGAEDMTL